jgi:hypothetical protein
MERKPMKRVNVILEADLSHKARVVAFLRKRSLSEIVRNALRDWLTANIDADTELILSERDERRLLQILASDEFVPLNKARDPPGCNGDFHELV